jgi:hypothetical protein
LSGKLKSWSRCITNKDRLISQTYKLIDKTGANFNSVSTLFFLEAILKRIALSSYNKSFIFKGGFLLSSLLGIASRTTVDMDLLLKDQPFEEQQVLLLLEEILKVDGYDDIQYKIISIEPIRDEDI